NPVGDAVIPSARVAGLAAGTDLVQVDDGCELALPAQGADGAAHHAGLARGARTQHVAEPLLADASDQLRVGRPLHVAGTVRLHRTPDDKERSCLHYLRHNGDCRCGRASAATRAGRTGLSYDVRRFE